MDEGRGVNAEIPPQAASGVIKVGGSLGGPDGCRSDAYPRLTHFGQPRFNCDSSRKFEMLRMSARALRPEHSFYFLNLGPGVNSSKCPACRSKQEAKV